MNISEDDDDVVINVDDSMVKIFCKTQMPKVSSEGFVLND